MLKYNNINLLFIAIVLIFSALIYTIHLPWWILIIIFFIYTIVLVLGSVFIRLNFYTFSLSKLKDDKSVLLTFDDGPDQNYTPQILDLLDQYQAKAAFFLIGKNIIGNEKVVKEIYRRGHIIGNHSYSHSPYFDIYSVDRMLKEVEQTQKMIEEITGEKPIYFRPPFGVTNPRINRLIERSGMKSVAWSFRSFDGGKRSGEKIIHNVKRNIKGGEIMLFHDNRAQSVEILSELLPWLSQNFNLNTNLDKAK